MLGIDEQVGNSTNGWKMLEYLREEELVVDRVALFTDMQIWDSSRLVSDDRTVRELFDAYRDQVASDGQAWCWRSDGPSTWLYRRCSTLGQ